MITKLHAACQIPPTCNSSGFAAASPASPSLPPSSRFPSPHPSPLCPPPHPSPQPGVWPQTLFMNICSALNIPQPPPRWKGSCPFDSKINMPAPRLPTPAPIRAEPSRAEPGDGLRVAELTGGWIILFECNLREKNDGKRGSSGLFKHSPVNCHGAASLHWWMQDKVEWR